MRAGDFATRLESRLSHTVAQSAAKRTTFRSPGVEAVYWIASLLITGLVMALWVRQGYWIWKDNDSFVFAGLFVCLFFAIGPLTLAVIPFLRKQNRDRIPEFVRFAQITLPFFGLLFAFWGYEDVKNRSTDFEAYRASREAVVEELRSHRFRYPDSDMVTVSQPGVATRNLVYLAKEDGVFMVWFPTQKWAIDNHRGFVYSDSGKPPKQFTFLDTRRIERINDHWFWISTT